MDMMIRHYAIIAILAPLFGAVVAGLFGKRVGVKGASYVTIAGLAVAFICSLLIVQRIFIHGSPLYLGNIYSWATTGNYNFHVGLLIDRMSSLMMVMVTFVSLLVHIYSIGYMKGDPGYQRFFAYMSLFTFAMLSLVAANNFVQMFFGWEGVGLVSYLLIGFWFKKDSAATGSFKAFVVNRVGDLGFVIGIAATLMYFGSLDFAHIFKEVPYVSQTMMQILPGWHVHVVSFICIALFIGAMAKSAQVPLHIWLPESMEGPTPISALIHAATMVTAGIYMVARMSPLFEHSAVALSLALIIGATGGLFLGFIAMIENDIKRVIAYSTMSQLGYMMAANGASAFAGGMFHLFTHACFKALLFLGAGSIILALHHEQDLRKMGGLRRYLPITYVCFLIGSLALAAIPPFSGFFSKEPIIEATRLATVPGAHYAYYCLLLGCFVTAFYTFRAFFMAFHGKENFDPDLKGKVHEQGWVVWLPLVLLAIPSIFLGGLMAKSILYSNPGLLGNSIFVSARFDVLGKLAENYHGVWSSVAHAFTTASLWCAFIGVATAWLFTLKAPQLADICATRLRIARRILVNKYGIDAFNQLVFVRWGTKLGQMVFKYGDVKVIDHMMVDGSGRGMTRFAGVVRRLQSGYLYHYVFVMIIGILAFMIWLMF